jgi:hypothetical protein
VMPSCLARRPGFGRHCRSSFASWLSRKWLHFSLRRERKGPRPAPAVRGCLCCRREIILGRARGDLSPHHRYAPSISLDRFRKRLLCKGLSMACRSGRLKFPWSQQIACLIELPALAQETSLSDRSHTWVNAPSIRCWYHTTKIRHLRLPWDCHNGCRCCVLRLSGYKKPSNHRLIAQFLHWDFVQSVSRAILKILEANHLKNAIPPVCPIPLT